MICTCGSIGRIDGLRRCPTCHRYWLGDRELVSVTKVINRLCPPDFSKVPPDLLEAKRNLGIFVDSYFSDWLSGPTDDMLSLSAVRSMIQSSFPINGEKYADQTISRIDRLCNWWMKSNLKPKAIQGMVFSEADGTAGTFDIATEDCIIDLKNTSALQPSYALQLGAYLSMDGQGFPLRDAAILHVTAEKIQLIPYESKKIRSQWRHAVNWYKTLQEL